MGKRPVEKFNLILCLRLFCDLTLYDFATGVILKMEDCAYTDVYKSTLKRLSYVDYNPCKRLPYYRLKFRTK